MKNDAAKTTAENSTVSDVIETPLTFSMNNESSKNIADNSTSTTHQLQPSPSNTDVSYSANAQNSLIFTHTDAAAATGDTNTSTERIDTILTNLNDSINETLLPSPPRNEDTATISSVDAETVNSTPNSENQILFTASEEGFVYDQHNNFVSGLVVRDGTLVPIDNEHVTVADVVRIQSAMAYKIAKINSAQSNLSKEMSQMRSEFCSFMAELKGAIDRSAAPMQTAQRDEISMEKVEMRKLIDSIAEFEELEQNLQCIEYKNKMVCRYSIYFRFK